MKFFPTILAVLLTVVTANASSIHDSRALFSRHHRISPRSPTLISKSVKRKRCKSNSTGFTHGVAEPSHTSSKPKPTIINSSPPPKDQSGLPNFNNSSGVINVHSNCGNIGATRKTTRTSGPNGSIDWLNCGLENGGWRPPIITVDKVIAVPLSTAISSGQGPFLACSKFLHMFEKYGGQYGIPPIMLASFAMQESSCNPNTVGGAGEQGLMQITKEKCGGAPGGNCRDPDFNIRTGARYFAKTLGEKGGNLVEAVANYNGWTKGLTYAKATAAAKSGCCPCQNNCDYLHQFFNGWLQNIDAYNMNFRLGKYFNLDVCK